MIARDSLNIEVNQGEVLRGDKSRSNSVAGGRFMSRFWDTVKRTVTGDTAPPPELETALAELRTKTPTPILWLLGKTQSGKTTIIRFLTGAEEAVIGSGFRPCTRTSRLYQFPTADAPLLTFLDTRGVDEPGYDATEDIAAFDPQAHIVLVTVKATDFAQGNVRTTLERIRAASPSRPVVLVVTCLHEAIPRQDITGGSHPPLNFPEPVQQCIDEHKRAFAGLFDVCVPIDITKPEDGFANPNYGGDQLKQTLLDVLPAAYRQTLMRLKEATDKLKSAHLRHAIPIIIGYTSMAGTAGAIPFPFVDLVLLPSIQARMANHLAGIYGQPMTNERLKELGAAVGVGLVARSVVRQAVKFIPFVGSAVGATVAAASTYALGRALCYYFEAVCEGHIPTPDALRKFYHDQYEAAEKQWKADHAKDEKK